MVNQVIRPANGVLPTNYNPWRRLLAAIILRGYRDKFNPKYRDEASKFLICPYVVALLKDEFGLCLE